MFSFRSQNTADHGFELFAHLEDGSDVVAFCPLTIVGTCAVLFYRRKTSVKSSLAQLLAVISPARIVRREMPQGRNCWFSRRSLISFPLRIDDQGRSGELFSPATSDRLYMLLAEVFWSQS